MFQAQLLMAGTDVYSPWFPRGGDYLRATLEVVAQSGGNNLTVRVFSKKAEDTGDGANADNGDTTTIVRNSAGRTTTEWQGKSLTPGLSELVRYKFSLAGSTGWSLFRMLDPVWFNAVAI